MAEEKETGTAAERIQQFKSEVTSLKERGFHFLGAACKTSDIPIKSIADQARSVQCKDMATAGGFMSISGGMFDNGGGKEKPVTVKDRGSKEKGYIAYGRDNSLPNRIYNYASSLPYTASAIKYIVDLTTGLGPALMYKWAHYTNGTVKEELIPYESAGVLLRNRIRELNNQLAAQQKEDDTPDDGQDDGTSQSDGKTITWGEAIHPVSEGEGAAENEPEEKEEDYEPGTLEYEIDQLKKDYARWEKDKDEIKKFIDENNIALTYQRCMDDDVHMDMYIPTITFSKGRAKQAWKPSIVSIGHIPVVCGRLEEMDEHLNINYVYYSEKWRQEPEKTPAKDEVVAYPAVMQETMLRGWRGIVEKNKNAAVGRRPGRVACPIRYPSPKPYYPQPAWWSIFPSMVYSYASTLITDKAIARQNSTMWSKIIFIDSQYLDAIYASQGAEGDPKKEAEIREQIYNNVKTLLENRENNGKTLMMDMYPAADGKSMQYSVEIVDVPQMNNAREMKDELEEISSIIFFALGLHPDLVGAVPGKRSSSGGTMQRELTLLKQNQVSPRQRAFLKFLQDVFTFNEYDPHATWVIRQQVLTTLDRSKTGTEDVNAD